MRAIRSAVLLVIVGCLIASVSPGLSVSTYYAPISSSGKIQYSGQSKKIVWRTSRWLADSDTYGGEKMVELMQQIHATDMMIYFKDSDTPDWQWENLNNLVDFFRSKGFTIWLIMAKTTLDEPAGTTYSVQYVIDAFKGRITGIMFDIFCDVDPTTATNWLLSKKQQLEANGMECMYYHGDGCAPDYGDPSTDVNATYLNSQGLIVFAWLQNNNSWKPMTFNLPRFWIDYDILKDTSWGGPTGQSYDEIYNKWYLGNVIGKDDLKNNAGCEALVFMAYMDTDYPNQDAINGMIAVANDWLGVTS